MSMYQRVLKALCVLLVAYAGCLAIAGLALIGVAVAGTSLDLQIDGAAVTGAEAIALCAAAGTVFLIVGLLDVIVAILGLRGVRRPEALKPFIVCASIILALNVANTAYSAATCTFGQQSPQLAAAAFRSGARAFVRRAHSQRACRWHDGRAPADQSRALPRLYARHPGAVRN